MTVKVMQNNLPWFVLGDILPEKRHYLVDDFNENLHRSQSWLRLGTIMILTKMLIFNAKMSRNLVTVKILRDMQ